MFYSLSLVIKGETAQSALTARFEKKKRKVVTFKLLHTFF